MKYNQGESRHGLQGGGTKAWAETCMGREKVTGNPQLSWSWNQEWGEEKENAGPQLKGAGNLVTTVLLTSFFSALSWFLLINSALTSFLLLSQVEESGWVKLPAVEEVSHGAFKLIGSAQLQGTIKEFCGCWQKLLQGCCLSLSKDWCSEEVHHDQKEENIASILREYKKEDIRR